MHIIKNTTDTYLVTTNTTDYLYKGTIVVGRGRCISKDCI